MEARRKDVKQRARVPRPLLHVFAPRLHCALSDVDQRQPPEPSVQLKHGTGALAGKKAVQLRTRRPTCEKQSHQR
eukprot:11207493-Alexandrium_andersonii.AAC.1